MLTGDFLGKYQVRILKKEDAPAVVELCQGNPLYYQYCPPQATEESILKDMEALPPRKTAEDKFYLGFYQGEELVAVMDLIRKCPSEQAVFIGFFMVRAQCQGLGLGSAIVEECCRRFREDGFGQVRLGFVEGNQQSRAFWEKNGFVPTGLKDKRPEYTVIIMERLLP